MKGGGDDDKRSADLGDPSQNQAHPTTISKPIVADGVGGVKVDHDVENGDARGDTDKGLPGAAVYDSEKERLAALVPTNEEEIARKKRKLKARKLIARKTGTSLNPKKVSLNCIEQLKDSARDDRVFGICYDGTLLFVV